MFINCKSVSKNQGINDVFLKFDCLKNLTVCGVLINVAVKRSRV
jgi:hypothetical protein